MKKISFALIRTTVEEALTSGRPILIEGYKASDGAVRDYILRLQTNGHEFYLGLVKQALQYVSAGKVQPPEDVDKDTWNQGVMEQVLSWSRTMDNRQPARAKHEKLSSSEAGVVYRDDGVVVVQCAEKLSEVTHIPNPKVTMKALKTRVKEYLVSHTPLSSLSPRLNLSAEKIDNIRVLTDDEYNQRVHSAALPVSG